VIAVSPSRSLEAAPAAAERRRQAPARAVIGVAGEAVRAVGRGLQLRRLVLGRRGRAAENRRGRGARASRASPHVDLPRARRSPTSCTCSPGCVAPAGSSAEHAAARRLTLTTQVRVDRDRAQPRSRRRLKSRVSDGTFTCRAVSAGSRPANDKRADGAGRPVYSGSGRRWRGAPCSIRVTSSSSPGQARGRSIRPLRLRRRRAAGASRSAGRRPGALGADQHGGDARDAALLDATSFPPRALGDKDEARQLKGRARPRVRLLRRHRSRLAPVPASAAQLPAGAASSDLLGETRITLPPQAGTRVANQVSRAPGGQGRGRLQARLPRTRSAYRCRTTGPPATTKTALRVRVEYALPAFEKYVWRRSRARPRRQEPRGQARDLINGLSLAARTGRRPGPDPGRCRRRPGSCLWEFPNPGSCRPLASCRRQGQLPPISECRRRGAIAAARAHAGRVPGRDVGAEQHSSPRASTTPNSVGGPQRGTSGDLKAGKPQSWDEVERDAALKAQRDAELPQCQAKLDTDFNATTEVRGRGLSPTSARRSSTR